MTDSENSVDLGEDEKLKAKTTKGAISAIRKANDLDHDEVIGQKEYRDKFVIVFSNGQKYEALK